MLFLSPKSGLASIIVYLDAGIAIGPWGLKLVTNVQDILHFTEFGVVLMLSVGGLELEPKRLWNSRRRRQFAVAPLRQLRLEPNGENL